jgi:hypothetical protein
MNRDSLPAVESCPSRDHGPTKELSPSLRCLAEDRLVAILNAAIRIRLTSVGQYDAKPRAIRGACNEWTFEIDHRFTRLTSYPIELEWDMAYSWENGLQSVQGLVRLSARRGG